MVTLEVLKEVIVDNRRILEGRKFVPRELRVSSFPRCIFIGGRGVGKTHCLFAKIKELLGQGRTVEDLVYVNFNDERLADFDHMDFNRILTAHAELTGKSDLQILFLDEVQRVECWEMIAERMSMAQESVYFEVTIAGAEEWLKTRQLGGVYRFESVFPLNFREYLHVFEENLSNADIHSPDSTAHLKQAFQRYTYTIGLLNDWGMPIRQLECDLFLNSIAYQAMSLDRSFRDVGRMLQIIRQLSEVVGEPVSNTDLAEKVSTVGRKVSPATVRKGLDALRATGLVFGIETFGDVADYGEKKKYYFVDHALIEHMNPSNRNAVLENIVVVELLHRYGIDNVFFIPSGKSACFVMLFHHTVVEFTSTSKEQDCDNTENRYVPIPGDLQIRRRIRLTYDVPRPQVGIDERVEVIPLWRWLLEDDTL